ncbi:MAG: MFS transporter permease [Desulfobacterales bacterium]|jgi:hypothetical protein|nr:MFS transporter permease [Desulfobacterales bacterium]
MTKDLREFVIQKEDAVFWMDKDGRWRNSDGRFKHKKIIDYFHASISKDANGYFVSQIKGDCLEKVYFSYEDTALFVIDIICGPQILLILNTRKKIPLNPDSLYLHNDNLYVMDGEDRIKFAEYALIKISAFVEDNNDGLFISIGAHRYKIHEKL